MNWKLVSILIFASVCSIFGEEKKDPHVGHWNVTKDNQLCIKMDGGIRLDITYETEKGPKTVTIVSDNNTNVDDNSFCKNSSLDHNETLILSFDNDRTLTFNFTRDKNITGDANEKKWQLHNVKFDFTYDDKTFPDSKKKGQDSISSDHPLNLVEAPTGNSFGCGNPDAWKIDDRLTVTMNEFKVQPFITGSDFGQVQWCAKEQTSDLIPIIIGAALAALVIIVLIAYLVGRARNRTPTYDNIGN